MKIFKSIKGLFKRINTPNDVFKDAIWKAQRFDMAMNALELNKDSKFETNKFYRVETECTVTLNVDVIKLLNSLGVVVSDAVKLNIIDNRDIYSNLLEDKENMVEVTVGVAE